MKKLLFFLFISALTATNFSCKKNPSNPIIEPVDTTKQDTFNYNYFPVIKTGFNLNKLPIDSFKKLLNGKWRFYTEYYLYKNSIVEFNFINSIQDSLKHYNDTLVFSDGACFVTKQQWSGTDSINYIRFNTLPSGHLWVWKTDIGNDDSLYIFNPEMQFLIIKIH